MPGLLPTIVLMFILKVGYILDTGFEQVLVFYNPAVYDVADIIQTYVYRLGMGQMDFPLSTALGLFNSVVAFVLIVSANMISKKTDSSQHLVREGRRSCIKKLNYQSRIFF